MLDVGRLEEGSRRISNGRGRIVLRHGAEGALVCEKLACQREFVSKDLRRGLLS